jgi:hypothetical protein
LLVTCGRSGGPGHIQERHRLGRRHNLITIGPMVTIRLDLPGTGENAYPFWSVKGGGQAKTSQGSKARKEPKQACLGGRHRSEDSKEGLMSPRRWIRIAIAISLGAALATLPALPAVSQQAPATVELGDTATLAARGGAACHRHRHLPSRQRICRSVR